MYFPILGNLLFWWIYWAVAIPSLRALPEKNELYFVLFRNMLVSQIGVFIFYLLPSPTFQIGTIVSTWLYSLTTYGFQLFLIIFYYIFQATQLLMTYILELSLLILAAEIWFYTAHWLLHRPLFYGWHKLHHRYKEPFAAEALFCSIPEMFFCNFLSISWTFLWVDYSGISTLLWAVIVVLNSLLAHSQPGYHRLHHHHFNRYYGVTGLLDALLRTN